MTQLPSSLDGYRSQLERAVAADKRRRRRRRAGGALAAVAAVLVVVNLLPSGDDRPGVPPASAVERAAQALEPRSGTILHMHIKARQFEKGRPDVRWEHETWMRVGSGAMRTVQDQPSGPFAETAVGEGVESLWDAKRERVLEKPSNAGADAFAGDMFRSEALELLRSGRATVTELRDALRIEDGRLAYIVDADDYTPVSLHTRGTTGGTVLRFVAYESLPLNAETEKLLSIAAQHPDAPVVRDAAAYDAALTRLFPNG